MHPPRWSTPSSLLSFALPLLLLASAPAEAQRRGGVTDDDTRLMHLLSYTGTRNRADIAGVAGSDVEVLGASGAGLAAIEGLRWGERGDEPCWIFVGTTSGGTPWNGCGPESYRAERSLEGGEAHLVGIAVCTNGRSNARGDLVKGVRAVWARHPEQSRPRRGETTRTAQMPNCADWTSTVRCRQGSAAGRIRVHHVAIGGRRGIVGLQLVCNQLDEECWEVSPGLNDDVLTAVPLARCRGRG